MLDITKYQIGNEDYPNGMTRNDFIKEYKKFIHETGLAVKDCVVGYGGSCLLFKIRQSTSDIDLGVPLSFFNKCKNSGKFKLKTFKQKPDGPDIESVVYNHVIDLHEQLDEETVIIDGVCTWSPEVVYKFKMMMNRPKDQADIIALRKKYKFSLEEMRQTLDGYWLGTQSGYEVTVPGLGEWKSETGIRGRNFPIWYHQVDGEGKVYGQKYNDAIDGYQPYDWDKNEYLDFKLFRNYDGKSINGPAN